MVSYPRDVAVRPGRLYASAWTVDSTLVIEALLGGLIALVGCTAETGTQGDGAGPCDIAAKLATVPGLTVAEAPSMQNGYRFFRMTYDQPEDHTNPSGARLRQRLTLLHRDCSAPNVIHNGGYFVAQQPSPMELTRMTEANQIAMEHRFFGPSRATSPDWSKLDIAQAAADQHRVIVAFKAIYGGRWLSTGTSKGGMASIFHRRFYSDDVDGTFAYWAPIMYEGDLAQTPENRFVQFVASVGTDAACRQRLRDFQRLVLTRRSAMKAAMVSLAASQNTVYDRFLGLDKALEFATEQAPFLFGNTGRRHRAPTSRRQQHPTKKSSLFSTRSPTSSTGPTQLSRAICRSTIMPRGSSATPRTTRRTLRICSCSPDKTCHERTYRRRCRLGLYSDASMRDVQGWLRTQGKSILLLYGQNDPWTAGAFELGTAHDSFRFDVPRGQSPREDSRLARSGSRRRPRRRGPMGGRPGDGAADSSHSRRSSLATVRASTTTRAAGRGDPLTCVVCSPFTLWIRGPLQRAPAESQGSLAGQLRFRPSPRSDSEFRRVMLGMRTR